jgi:hypothetical protein
MRIIYALVLIPLAGCGGADNHPAPQPPVTSPPIDAAPAPAGASLTEKVCCLSTELDGQALPAPQHLLRDPTVCTAERGNALAMPSACDEPPTLHRAPHK